MTPIWLTFPQWFKGLKAREQAAKHQMVVNVVASHFRSRDVYDAVQQAFTELSAHPEQLEVGEAYRFAAFWVQRSIWRWKRPRQTDSIDDHVIRDRSPNQEATVGWQQEAKVVLGVVLSDLTRNTRKKYAKFLFVLLCGDGGRYCFYGQDSGDIHLETEAVKTDFGLEEDEVNKLLGRIRKALRKIGLISIEDLALSTQTRLRHRGIVETILKSASDRYVVVERADVSIIVARIIDDFAVSEREAHALLQKVLRLSKRPPKNFASASIIPAELVAVESLPLSVQFLNGDDNV